MLPSVEELLETFLYDPETGQLTGKVAKPGKPAGYVAGCRQKDKSGITYISVRLGRNAVLAHRIIWAIQTGAWPQSIIDHRDGDGTNNRWSNLRLSNAVKNAQNQTMNKRNKTGITGVMWHKQIGKWHAAIKINGAFVHLGVSDSLFEMCCARRSAENRAGFDPSHGRPKRTTA